MKKPNDAQLQKLFHNYQSNYMRHLLALSRHFRSRLMHHLQEECGFEALRLNWEPLLSLPGSKGIPLGVLAEELGISKQNCDQLVRSIENEGFVKRIPAPDNKRTRLVILTDYGNKVIKAGIKQTALFEKENSQTIGLTQYQSAAQSIQCLCSQLQIPQYSADRSKQKTNASLIAPLIRLASFAQKRLMELTIARGHPGLQLSYGQVLNHIGLRGAGIQELAEINEVTKQAIVRIANQLEYLGYTCRIKDPAKPRSKRIVLTPKGLQLLDDAIKALDELKAEWLETLSEDAFKEIEQILFRLYQKTAPRDFSDASDNEINIYWQQENSDKDKIEISTLLLAIASHLDNNTDSLIQNKTETEQQFTHSALKAMGKAVIRKTDADTIIENKLGKKKADALLTLLRELSH